MSMQRYETSLMLSFLGTVVTFKTNNLTKDQWFLCCIKSLKIALKKHPYSHYFQSANHIQKYAKVMSFD